MPPLIVQDPTIGNELSQALGSIAQGPQMFKLGVETRKLLDERKARDEYVAKNREYWMAQQPPSVPLPEGWQGPASPPNEQETRQFNLARDRQLATMNLGGRLATSYGDVATNDPKMMGQSQVQLYGMPQTREGLLKLNTQLEGKIPDGLIVPKGLTEPDMKERWGQLQVLATNGDLTPAQAREAQVLHPFMVPSKVTVMPNGDSATHPERDLSALEANMLAKAQRALPAPIEPTTTGASAAAGTPAAAAATAAAAAQTPDPQLAQQAVPATASNRGAFQTVPGASTAGPPVTPAAAAAAPGAAPPAATAPATAPASSNVQTSKLPGGGVVTFTRASPGAPSSLEGYKVSAAVQNANEARQHLEGIIGYRRDPQTDQGTLPPNYYVPNLASSTIMRRYGNEEAGQAAAQAIEKVWQGGDSKVAGYNQRADIWVENVVRLVSGATVLPSERANYRSMFIPNSQDSKELVAAKLDAMRRWEQVAATAGSARDAIAAMQKVAAERGNPLIAEQASMMQRAVIAKGGEGALDRPLPRDGAPSAQPGQAPAPQQAAPTQAPSAAPPAAPPAPGRMRYDAKGNRIQ